MERRPNLYCVIREFRCPRIMVLSPRSLLLKMGYFSVKPRRKQLYMIDTVEPSAKKIPTAKCTDLLIRTY